MAKAKLPYMKFYTGDWWKDTRHLSPLARGIWFDLICLMWDAKQRGTVTDTLANLAQRVTVTVADFTSALGELSRDEVETVSREDLDDGRIRLTCRRIVRDERKRAQASRYGALGGNPKLKNEDNATLKARLNPTVASGYGYISPGSGEVQEGESEDAADTQINAVLVACKIESYCGPVQRTKIAGLVKSFGVEAVTQTIDEAIAKGVSCPACIGWATTTLAGRHASARLRDNGKPRRASELSPAEFDAEMDRIERRNQEDSR